jgi:hypothetical protein
MATTSATPPVPDLAGPADLFRARWAARRAQAANEPAAMQNDTAAASRARKDVAGHPPESS